MINFSDKQHFRLRPLLSALKDWAQIERLIVESFEHLACAASIFMEREITSSQLWEHVDAFMTDSVAKNLEVEKIVPRIIGLNHIPYHILCKSHLVEKLDKSNFDVLSKLEKSVSLREKFEFINPALLQPFFHSKIAIVESRTSALLHLVAYDKSANSCSLADAFEYTVEREGKVKYLSLYHQSRFAKLGCSAVLILEVLTLFQMLLNETEMDNLLVQACRLYTECEFFITKLQALIYFTHKITLPFLLICVEVCDQLQLTHIILMLYEDLSAGEMDTLDNYNVIYKHLNIQEPDTVLGKEILNLMCTNAALGIKLQCGREYGFSDHDVRAIELHKLNKGELKGLQTNNLVTERDLSKFSHLSQAVAS